MHGKRLLAFGAGLAVTAMLVAACGGSSGGSGGGAASSQSTKNLFQGSGLDIEPAPKTPGDPDAGFTPKRGGKITYGLEADDTGGYCLPEAQLDISGEQVAQSIYDTLTRPGAAGKYHPYLAQSVTHSPDYKTWTITIRQGIKFSNGSPLTAQVVKNNLDAYRGKYPGRKALLFLFVLSNIDNTTVTSPTTVDVTMKKPWVDFDAFLFSQGRLGIISQSQLDDPSHCFDHLVGTGPFELVSWAPNERYVLKPNPNYWVKAPDGKPYPYLSELDYVPIIDETQRLSALDSGQINAMLTADGANIVSLRSSASANKVRLITSVKYTELAYLLLNATKPPFNNILAREAASQAIDFNTINKIIGKNVSPLQDGPFPRQSPGYLANPGFKRYDPANAKKLVQQYKQQTGQAPNAPISSTNDPTVIRTAEFIQKYLQDAGFTSSITPYDQAQLINNGVSKNFTILTWRNHGGIDPDEQYVWWYGGSPVNFGGFNDPVINQLLDQGRATPDPAQQAQIYQNVNRQFAKQVWNIWGAASPWTVATAPNVHGVFGPDLPDGSKPWQALLNGNPAWGMWVG
jgi:peptide/nickel transport system substrate-binding protein